MRRPRRMGAFLRGGGSSYSAKPPLARWGCLLNDNPTKKEAMTPSLAYAQSNLPSANPNVPRDEGTRLAGKYRVAKVLGRGGMGVVVAAMHVELDQRVAL